jgi:hypothetical protein
MAREEEGEAATVFADALADLKRRGSVLLLTGTDRESRRAACQRLLGDVGAGPRRRLFVGVGEAPDAPGPAASDDARRLVYRTQTRSAATTAGGAASGAGTRVVDGGLPALKRAVDEEIDALAGPDPETGTVRVCLRDADALLAAHEEEAVFGFFHGLGGTARDVGGMFHVHLPAPTDSEAARTLTPLFDAVIETREGSQQRWHLREPELTTEWLTL